MYKYVYKGHNRAAVAVSTTTNNANAQEDADEIRQYLDSRYVSASEGCWRLFSFSLHKEFPAHQRLAIHHENEQLVTFHEDADPAVVADRAHETTLTAWFQYNRDHPNDTEAHQTLYPDFPERFVFLDDSRRWKIRERGHGGTIGRVYNVTPREVEKYHLRLLLYHVPGAKDFRDLRIVNGDEQPTYQAAARLLGLLSGQQEWNDCLEQATHYQMPYAMRQLFAIILAFCSPGDPLELWVQHRDALAEDFRQAARAELQDSSLPFNDYIYDQALLAIEDVMIGLSRSLTDFRCFTLPEDTRRGDHDDSSEPFIIREHRSLTRRLQLLPEPTLSFNEDQQRIYDAIFQSLRSPGNMSKVFFVDGPGGTGKTHLFNSILDTVRRAGDVAIAVAISGTASVLLHGGRTAHSTFIIPLKVDGNTYCITPRSPTARLLKMAKLIIWDEASMISRHVIETVNRSLQDLMKNVNEELETVPFGGKVVVFGGDFRQVFFDPFMRAYCSLLYPFFHMFIDVYKTGPSSHPQCHTTTNRFTGSQSCQYLDSCACLPPSNQHASTACY